MGGKPLLHLRRIFQKNLSLFSATRGGQVGGPRLAISPSGVAVRFCPQKPN